MAAVKAGILGATGAVGQRFVEALANHPWFEITALAASERSAGKTYREAAGWRLDTAMPESVENIEVVPVDPKQLMQTWSFQLSLQTLPLQWNPSLQKPGLQLQAMHLPTGWKKTSLL